MNCRSDRHTYPVITFLFITISFIHYPAYAAEKYFLKTPTIETWATKMERSEGDRMVTDQTYTVVTHTAAKVMKREGDESLTHLGDVHIKYQVRDIGEAHYSVVQDVSFGYPPDQVETPSTSAYGSLDMELTLQEAQQNVNMTKADPDQIREFARGMADSSVTEIEKHAAEAGFAYRYLFAEDPAFKTFLLEVYEGVYSNFPKSVLGAMIAYPKAVLQTQKAADEAADSVL